jgi:hypothetical protein
MGEGDDGRDSTGLMLMDWRQADRVEKEDREGPEVAST